jgi:hypothetical protein
VAWRFFGYCSRPSAKFEEMCVFGEGFAWQKKHKLACVVDAVGASQSFDLAVGQLDGFGHQVAVQQDLDGHEGCACAARGCR